LDDDVFLVKLC